MPATNGSATASDSPISRRAPMRLSALQARIGHGKDIDGWLEARGLAHARRLWQVVDIEPGWEDALEAVLRERLNALELARLDDALAWVADGTPGRRADRRVRVAGRRRTRPMRRGTSSDDALFAKVRANDAARRAAARRRPARRALPADLAAALAARDGARRRARRSSRPKGHRVSAQGVAFFAPDSELHGVLARQRELDELAGLHRHGDDRRGGRARAMLDTVERDLAGPAGDVASGKPGARVAAAALPRSRARARAVAPGGRGRGPRGARRLAQESDDLAAQHAQGTRRARGDRGRHRRPAIAVARSRWRKRDAARHARNEAEVALARGRERVARRRARGAGGAASPSAAAATASRRSRAAANRWRRRSRSSRRCSRN